MRHTVVAIETSARPATVAVRVGDRTRGGETTDRSHARDLLPTLDALLKELDGSPDAVTAVLVGTGPGSYTGLRVGIATALGLARATGAAVRGVPSGESLAWRELEPEQDGIHLLDARSGQLYVAHYRRLDDEIESVVAPTVVTPEELGELLPPDVPIFGDEAAAKAGRLDEGARARLVTGRWPRAEALLELGAQRIARRGGERPEDVAPLYLRPFAAKKRRR